MFFCILSFAIIKDLDFEGFNVILAQVRAVLEQLNKLWVFSSDSDFIKKSFIKTLMGGDGVFINKFISLQTYSIMTLIAARNRIIKIVQPVNIPRKCWCQLEWASEENDRLQKPL